VEGRFLVSKWLPIATPMLLQVQVGGLLNMAKRQVEEHREQYEQMVAEDREMDRSFRRDFADCEPHVDQLYKLFRKRPRWVKTLATGLPLSMPPLHTLTPPLL